MSTIIGKRQRQSNFELLRIIAMLMIVAYHFTFQSGVLGSRIDENVFFSYLMGAYGRIAVNLFIFISVYFMWDSNFNMSRFVKVWLETVLYLLLFSIISMLFLKKFSYSVLLHCFFPIFGLTVWFISIYLILYSISPFLKKGLLVLCIEQHKLLTFLLFAVICIPSTYWFTDTRFDNILWFVYIYS